MESFKVFINFKTYLQGTGERAVGLVNELERVNQLIKGNVEIVPIVQVVDLWRVKQETKLAVWVQNVDSYPQGKFTGWTNLEAVVEAGAEGTLINHSEHPVPPGTVKQVVGRVNQFQPEADRPVVENKLIKGKDGSRQSSNNKFFTMVCARTLGQVERLVKLKPDYIGYEIAELIGTKTSITATNPKAIEHAVKVCGEIPLVVGAGMNSANDLIMARKLGAKGILISSAIVLDKNPVEKLKKLLNVF